MEEEVVVSYAPKYSVCASSFVYDMCEYAFFTGGRHTCAILDNGSVKCWGNNWWGQLGIGNTDPKCTTPIDPGVLGTNATQISTGYAHTCALLDGGTAKGWGGNSEGQLGIGPVGNQYIPPTDLIDLDIDRTVTQICTGGHHMCVILDNGSVKCWGYNWWGQLGITAVFIQYTPPTDPVNLGYNRTATQIATGFSHTCAILDNGNVTCWGHNSYGQLGIGSTVNKYLVPPVQSTSVLTELQSR